MSVMVLMVTSVTPVTFWAANSDGGSTKLGVAPLGFATGGNIERFVPGGRASISDEKDEVRRWLERW